MKNKTRIVSIFIAVCIIFSNAAFAHNNGTVVRNNNVIDIKILEHSVECIEEELDVRGTDIELELSNMLEYYNDLLLKERGNIEEQEKIKDLIEEIENQIENHTKYRAVESFRGENNDYEVESFRGKNNDYEFLLSECIAAVNTYFFSKKYYLSSELLMHAKHNNYLDSEYKPYHGSRVKSSPEFHKIKRSSKTHGKSEFLNHGNTYQRDLYYSIHGFRWYKDDEVITITDRYDFALAPYNNIAGVAVYMMYKAQQYGLLVPYKVKIKELY